MAGMAGGGMGDTGGDSGRDTAHGSSPITEALIAPHTLTVLAGPCDQAGLPVRQDDMVEQQRPDDVDRQPQPV
jgi:hypothetical protein